MNQHQPHAESGGTVGRLSRRRLDASAIGAGMGAATHATARTNADDGDAGSGCSTEPDDKGVESTFRRLL